MKPNMEIKKFLFIVNLVFRFNSCTFFYSYIGILMLDTNGINTQIIERNQFHRLKNSSYYVSIGIGTEHDQFAVKNYRIHTNGQTDNTLPHTAVKSSKFGINKKRPWLSNDSRVIRNNARAEEQVIYRSTILRAPELTIGDFKISYSAKNNLSTKDCGLYSSKYIVGGRQVPIGAHPWIVALLVNGQMWCSATIINEWWVVTAAHAFEFIGTDPQKVSIVAGNIDRTKGEQYRVSKIIVHSRYDVDKFKSSDVAVMKIEGPIKMSKNVRPICMPEQSYQEVRTSTLIVAGWGLTQYGVPGSPTLLRQVELSVIPIEKCAQIYSSIKYKMFKSQICTHNNGQDACQGDSGGPAIEFVNGKATLVGIVSYGVTCADKYPGVFTKVSYYLSWIQNAITKN